MYFYRTSFSFEVQGVKNPCPNGFRRRAHLSHSRNKSKGAPSRREVHSPLERQIGYFFKDKGLRRMALAHGGVHVKRFS